MRSFSTVDVGNVPLINRTLRRSSSRFHVNDAREIEQLPDLLCMSRVGIDRHRVAEAAGSHALTGG